jgi:DeoR/GlpR family transcriptional regulator of sugar metabolism
MEVPEPAQFAELLRRLRRRARVTQLQLASAIGYDVSHVSRLERAAAKPRDRGTVLAIIEALSIPPADANALLLAADFAELQPHAGEDTIPLRSDVERLKREVHGIREILLGARGPLQENRDVLAYARLLQESEFFLHSDRHRLDKQAIGREVVNNFLWPQCAVALDSGTTACEVAYHIIDSEYPVSRVFTNNLVAAIHFTNAPYPCTLAGGDLRLHEERFPYGALLGVDVRELAFNASPDLAILGTSYIDFDGGPCAPSVPDRDFKRVLLDAIQATDGRVVIVADCSKFVSKEPEDVPILHPDEWHRLRDRLRIVTAGLPEFDVARRKFRDELQRFGSNLVMHVGSEDTSPRSSTSGSDRRWSSLVTTVLGWKPKAPTAAPLPEREPPANTNNHQL